MTEEKVKVYPISEIFTSPQGEGQFAGCMMTFIRLAGCSVGKPYPKERYQSQQMQTSVGLEDISPEFPIYVEECHTWDGRGFPCDTDYRVKERLTCNQIVERIPSNVEHICITGGEPFIHNLVPLAMVVANNKKKIHIETSGTVHLHKAFPSLDQLVGIAGGVHIIQSEIWITVAPKLGLLTEMAERANEIKVLVDEHFDPTKLPSEVLKHPLVYLMAINYEFTVKPENMKLVMKWHKQYPQWRIGLQLHKVLEQYIGERVR